MGEVVHLVSVQQQVEFGVGDLVWLPTRSTFGTVLGVERTGTVKIATKGATLVLDLRTEREQIVIAKG